MALPYVASPKLKKLYITASRHFIILNRALALGSVLGVKCFDLFRVEVGVKSDFQKGGFP